MTVEAEPYTAAFQRFVDALQRPRDADALCAAVTDDVRIERHGPGERAAAGMPPSEPMIAPPIAPIVETFTGASEVARWLARTPDVVSFCLVGTAVHHHGELWAIEYAIIAGEFRNGGIWLARFAADGRIAFLSHRPFALPGAAPSG